MQSSKVLLVVGAAALCAIPLSGHGADKKASSAPKPVFIAPTPSSPDAISKAQEAMRQKMNELNGQPSAPAPQAPAAAAPQVPATAVPEAPAAAVPQAPAVAAPEPTPEAVPAVKQAAPEPANKAINALRQKMDELPDQPAVAAPAPVAVPQPAPVVVPAAPAVPPPTPVAAPVANTKMAPMPAMQQENQELIVKAREALRQKMAELPSQPVSVPAAKPAPAKPVKVAKAKVETESKAEKAAPAEAKRKAEKAPEPAKAKPVKAKDKDVAQPVVIRNAAQEFPALEGPGSPLGAEKQQRLAELLQKYKADQLTPEQYHLERAKVLAQP